MLLPFVVDAIPPGQMLEPVLLFWVGGGVDVLMAWTSRSSINRFATIGLVGEPMAAPSVCS